MKRLVITGIACFFAFVFNYHFLRYTFAGPWGWQWTDITLATSMFLLGIGATLYYIRFFTWRNAVEVEKLRARIATYPVPESQGGEQS